ncbi:golgi-to-ER vesicle coat component [Scheffersomyces xylosifermentans]|uniref:golgi-to-ER vesicle coat component n=1 Tax=Scheffersomyces xylosifermentans TaxID=1304137 RepID=UPI00315D39DE
MSLNISLYTISAVLILDNEGERLYANYYNHSGSQENGGESHFQTLAQQTKFESSIFSKINKAHQDIILYDNHLITYKQTNDIILVIVAKINENESLIYSTVATLFESLNILLDNTIDKSTIISKYDLVSLAIDETIDDGIIIEIEPAIIVSRVTNAPKFDTNVHVDLDKGIFDALSFASKKIGERLQQGF